jgi:hypothetical protein
MSDLSKCLDGGSGGNLRPFVLASEREGVQEWGGWSCKTGVACFETPPG